MGKTPKAGNCAHLPGQAEGWGTLMKDSDGNTTDLSVHVMALQDGPALRSVLLLHRAKVIPSLGEHRCSRTRAGREGAEGLLSARGEAEVQRGEVPEILQQHNK